MIVYRRRRRRMSNGVGPVATNSSATTTICMFYRLMVSSLLQENKLKIPTKFVKLYGKELSSIATLAGPNGLKWVVELANIDSKLWFHNGWHEFVDYYSIRAGHLLVFEYEGESNFYVRVYDLRVCEVSYPCNSWGSLQKPCLDNQVKQEPEDCGYSRDKEVQFNESELTTPPCAVVLPIFGEAGPVTRRRKQRTDSNVDEPKQKTRQRFDKVSCPGIASETFTRRWRSVTQEEKEKAIRVADMYKPDNPFFKVILRPSYVYRGFLMHIPRIFARKYLSSFSEFITLEVEGKKWSVRCVSGNGKAKLCKGWTEFVWGNRLEEGDICVFELLNMKDAMKVTIFRVLEDEAEEANAQVNHLS
ncbi:B3 domain-containing transcription factor VRN1-like [Euphorbia lathyris]|uniref:B3 domain-containing transcription factor VRN1-like n=1 Tax=Euphorbia lathyris TaxID=212925 RepID=UPI003313B1C2